MTKVGSIQNGELLSRMTNQYSNFIPTFKRKKSFINPFDPAKVHIEVNSHQCRWIHTFPRDTQGRAFQTHHINNKSNKHQLENLEEEKELAVRPFKSATSFIQNFALVRRSGMDWTSLTEPACLPLTTDYYPDETIISNDYLDYNSSLIANNYCNDFSTDKVNTGWRADHHNMSTYQVFKEMISQRIAQVLIDCCDGLIVCVCV